VEQRFHPVLHTSYTVDCVTALVDDVSSGYYVQCVLRYGLVGKKIYIEDGGTVLLRNIGTFVPKYTASHSRRM